MSFSLITIAIAMITAVILAYYIGAGITVTAAFVLFIIMTACFVIKKRTFAACFVLSASCLAAAVSYGVSAGSWVHPLKAHNERYAELSGTVMSNPESGSNSFRYIVKLDFATFAKRSLKCRESVLLSSPQQLECGNTIKFGGIIKELPKQMNENGFNYGIYYNSQNIYSRIHSDEIEVTGNKWIVSPYFLSQKLYRKIDSIIYQHFTGDRAAVISAVLTGNTHGFSEEYKAVMRKTGFSRVFHPAYMHLYIIMLVIAWLIGVVNKRYCDVLTIIVLIAYAVVSSSNIGFTKCLTVMAAAILYRRIKGSSYYPDVVAFIFICCALSMPMMVFNTALIISSAAGLLVWAFSDYVQMKLRIFPRRVRRSLSVMLICAFLLTPICTIWYDGVCVYSFLIPFIVMPIVFCILIAAPIAYILLCLFGYVPVLRGGIDFAAYLLECMPYAVSRMPFSYVSLPAPSRATILMIVCIIFMLYNYIRRNSLRLLCYGAAAAGLFISLAVSALMRIGTTEFVFVNVGQGDGAFIHTAYGATVIIDGGGGTPYSDYNPGEQLFVPYIRSRGIYNIDAAFISHFHQDHVQGIIAAVKELNVRNIYFMPPPEQDETAVDWYNKLSAAAGESGANMCPISEPTRLEYDGGLAFEIYPPDDELVDSGDGNDCSVLIKAEYGDNSFLYTGDITKAGEASFMASGIDVDADVLKIGHHGSKGSTSAEWREAVTPEYAVICCGENNNYGHPADETLITLKGIPIMRTDQNGDIRITVDKKRIKYIDSFR